MNESDEDLKGLFARQREADSTRAPGFYAMRARALSETPAPRPIALWRWGLSAAAALSLLIVALLWPAPRPSPTSYDTLARELDRAQASLHNHLAAQSEFTAWQSPTDFLLNPTQHNNP